LGRWKLTRRKTVRPEAGKVVETLCGVLVGEALGTFQLHNRHVFDQQIRKLFSDVLTLIIDRK
jgi:hypothetical protein